MGNCEVQQVLVQQGGDCGGAGQGQSLKSVRSCGRPPHCFKQEDGVRAPGHSAVGGGQRGVQRLRHSLHGSSVQGRAWASGREAPGTGVSWTWCQHWQTPGWHGRAPWRDAAIGLGWGHHPEWVLVTLPSSTFENPKWKRQGGSWTWSGSGGEGGALAQVWPLRLIPSEGGEAQLWPWGPALRWSEQRAGGSCGEAQGGCGKLGLLGALSGDEGRAEAQGLLQGPGRMEPFGSLPTADPRAKLPGRGLAPASAPASARGRLAPKRRGLGRFLLHPAPPQTLREDARDEAQAPLPPSASP